MKRIPRAIAFLLTLAMLASLLCIPALAEEGYDRYASLKEGTGYVALGDSYTRGYGCSDHWGSQNSSMDKYGSFNCRNVDGSYPNLIAEAFGLYAPDDIRDKDGKLWNLAKNAQSLAYVLDLLGIDAGYRDQEFIYDDGNLTSRYMTDLRYFGDERSYNLEGTGYYNGTAEVIGIHELMENADLITISLGQSDIIYKAQKLGAEALNLDDPASLPQALSTVISVFFESFERWKASYPLLLDYLKEANPDATVVLVGTMNPIQNVVLTEELALPVCSAINLIMDMMNKYTREFAEEYGYIYVDITNIDTPSSETTMTVSEALSLTDDASSLMSHPTPNGYAQIARLIISAVEETLPDYTPANPDTFINIDLGRFRRVDYVLLDGRPVDNYSVTGYVLTVPCYSRLAKNVTVAIVDEGGKTVVMSYSLSYNDGYTPYRIYENNDVAGTAKATVNAAAGTAKKLLSGIAGLFKK